jgi:multiple sugar transport system substrate-binding protein
VSDPNKVSRREFLRGAVLFGGSVATGTILAACGQQAPPVVDEEAQQRIAELEAALDAARQSGEGSEEQMADLEAQLEAAQAEAEAAQEAVEEAAAEEAMAAEGTGMVTVRVLSLPWPQTPIEQAMANEIFTPDSGVEVALEGPPYEFAESKMRELAASESPEFDIYEYDSQWLGAMVLAGGMENLDTADYFGSPDAEVQFEDFMPGHRDYLGRFPVNDKKALAGDVAEYQNLPIYGVAWTLGTNMLGYRVDLFEEAGLVDENGKAKPPETWDDFRDACMALTNDQRYGIAWYNTRLADGISMQWLPFHFSYGADIWDFDTFQIDGIINSPEAVEGLTEFVRYNQEYKVIDPGAANWFINELVNAVTQDLAAMWYTYVSFAAFTEDPNTSKTVGLWDYAPLPGYETADGEVRRVPIFACQGIGLNSHSEHKAEAWQYFQWLKSYDTEKALVDDPLAGYASARNDLEEYQFSQDTPAFHAKQVMWTSTPLSRDFPIWPEYKELLDIQQREVNLCYIGEQEPRETLDKIATLQQAVMDTSPNNPNA